MTTTTGFKKNQTTDVLVNFVLDASGSMMGLSKATIDGFNQFIQSQVDQTEGEIFVSLTLFNTSFDVRFVALDAKEVPHMGTPSNPYFPGGGTALFDAVGTSIKGAEAWLENHPSFKGKVVTVIWTDGGENSSKQYNQYQVNSLISAKQDAGWVFQFMGTGEEGWRQNNVLNAIPVHNRGWTASSADSLNTAYAGVSHTVSNLRSAGSYSWDQSLVDS